VSGLKKLLPALILAVFLLLTLPIALTQEYRPPHNNPGPAVDVVRIRSYAEEIAPAVIEKGDIDLYLFSMRVARVLSLEGKPGIRMVKSPSLSLSILLNPAPAPEGSLNPFSIKEVRQAVQLLIDRDFVTREIYKGLAAPMVTHLSKFEYDYITVADIVETLGVKYDPELAKQKVSDALSKAGATLRDGKWFYGDQPIRVKFVIRTEDERREIGDTLASELEKIGIGVERVYQPFGQAILRVYTTDPRSFEWHLYTEGWGKTALERNDFATINQMCSPWFGNMPGWQELGYWQYENRLLDDIGQKIFKGQFSTREERDNLYREAVRACLDESVRVWVAAVMTSTPVKTDMVGLTEDLGAGARGLWALREMYLPGRSELNVGHLWVWTSRTVWNPVGGFGDVFSVDIWRNVFDPPITRHPFTGLPMPFRASFKVETAGPDGRLEVPSDAFVWDADAKTWKNVERGTQAVSKVTYDYSAYTGSKWHHGIKISMADILYALSQFFDIAQDPTKSKIENVIAVTRKPIIETFKGFRIVDDSKLEVYVDFWHYEKSYIAEYAELWGGGMPWELLAAMDNVVFEKRLLTYTDTAAARFQVEQLSLVLKEHATLVRLSLSEFLSRQTFPEGVFKVAGKSYQTKEDALARYKAAMDWFGKYSLLVISNGPFQLTAFDPAAQFAELRAYRDPTYPFQPGKWYLGKAETPEVVSFDGKLLVGRESTFSIAAKGAGQLRLRYFLVDTATNSIIGSGEERAQAGKVSLMLGPELTSKLRPSLYRMSLLLYSDELAIIHTRTELVEATLPGQQTTTTPTPTTPTETTTKATQPPPPPPDSSGLIVAVVVAAVAVAAMGTVLFLRRRASPRTGRSSS